MSTTFDGFSQDLRQERRGDFERRRQAIVDLLTNNLGESVGRGHILAKMRDRNENGTPSRVALAARLLYDANPAVPQADRPKFDDPLAALRNRRPHSSAHDTRHEATAAEVQLLGLLGQRRDSLTDDEVRQAARLATRVKGDDVQQLAEYVLAPARARIDAAKAAHDRQVAGAAVVRAQARPTIPPDARRLLLEELEVVLAEQHDTLGPGEVARLAADEMANLTAAADAAHAARLAEAQAALDANPVPAPHLAPVVPLPLHPANTPPATARDALVAEGVTGVDAGAAAAVFNRTGTKSPEWVRSEVGCLRAAAAVRTGTPEQLDEGQAARWMLDLLHIPHTPPSPGAA